MKCLTCKQAMTGHKRKYCQPSCRPSFQEPRAAGLENCQVCGKTLQGIGKAGRPKRNCSKVCRERAHSKPKKPQVSKTCVSCNKLFLTVKPNQRFCRSSCRYSTQSLERAKRFQAQLLELYPEGIRTVDCGWCNQPRTFDIRKSTPNAYHPKCTLEAKRARYRIKTVKRQNSVVKPSRLAADEVLRTYGEKCHICQDQIDLTLTRTSRMGLTVDHVIPLSKGGSDNLDNLRPAHWICNVRKSDKTHG